MKKKNTRAKGDNAERIALKQLEVDHLVIRSPRKFIMLPGGRFISKENDYFGLWDLIAKKDGNTKWIQVKAGTKDHIYDKRREMEEFKDKY